MNALGKRRLLKLAKMVERHRRYDQSKFAHDCGTPACAWGTYVFNTPRLFKEVKAHMKEEGVSAEHSILFKVNVFDDARYYDEFGLEYGEAGALFSERGCGNAGKNAKKAAAYIRDFVARDGK